MSRTMTATWRAITPRAVRTSGSVRPSRPRVWTALRIGASGFRSSWASVARNSSLWRLASASSSARARTAETSWTASRISSGCSESGGNGRALSSIVLRPRTGNECSTS